MGFLQVIFKGCQYFILRVELTKLHQEETGENVKFDNFSEMSNRFVYCCLLQSALLWRVATGTQFCGLAMSFFPLDGASVHFTEASRNLFFSLSGVLY